MKMNVWSPDAVFAHVYLDSYDNELKYVVEFDTDEGWALVLKTDKDGVILHHTDIEWDSTAVTEYARGEILVKFVYPTEDEKPQLRIVDIGIYPENERGEYMVPIHYLQEFDTLALAIEGMDEAFENEDGKFDKFRKFAEPFVT